MKYRVVSMKIQNGYIDFVFFIKYLNTVSILSSTIIYYNPASGTLVIFTCHKYNESW